MVGQVNPIPRRSARWCEVAAPVRRSWLGRSWAWRAGLRLLAAGTAAGLNVLTAVADAFGHRAYHPGVAADAEFDAFAVLLRRGRDLPEMVSNMAERLERALPDQVEIDRGPLRRRVRSVVVRFNPDQFRIQLHGQRPLAWVDHVVRGICVRSDEIEFDEWLDRLAKALASESNRSTEIRVALEEALR